jgi:drug/metabolite transporter (DMT)-like permease
MAALFLLVTIFFWGTAFRATAIGAEHTSPIMLTALRAAPAALVLLAALLVVRGRLPSRPLWGITTVTGLLMVTLALEGISEGTARAGAANAAILLNASPFFVLVLGRLFYGERAPWPAVVGMLFGFAGIVVMVSTQLGAIEDMGNFLVGMAFALAGALGWAIGVLMTKSLFTREPDLDMLGFTTGQYLVGGAAALVLAFAIDGTGGTDWSSSELWAAVAWIAIGSSAIATLAFFGALKRMPAATVMAWQFLAPVVAVITEIVYGNTPDAVVLAGMVLAIVGVAVVNVAPQLSARLSTGRRIPWLSSARAR